MDSQELRRRFLEFFEKRGHTVVPSSSLVPDDPSVLLTTAGMQQFKPYYTELDPEKTIHPSIGKPIGLNAASCQKSFRTSDIDEVGDESHLTFFEMLGNFSFGGYFKERAITLAHEFITKELNLAISYVTVFEGKDSIGVPKDEESMAIWKSLGIPDEKIKEQGMEDVFWGPTGNSGPCGPTTEIYCKNKNAAGQDIEVWNIVFNQYFYPGSREELDRGVAGKKLELLKKPGVDTGMGLERLAMVAQRKSSIFETDLFLPSMKGLSDFDNKTKRIITDHLRGSIFLIVDGNEPSNKDRGYILRRLLRRVIFHIVRKEQLVSVPLNDRTQQELSERTTSIIKTVTDTIIKEYKSWYKELENQNSKVDAIIHKEIGRSIDLLKSHSEVDKLIQSSREGFTGMYIVPADKAFRISSTYGIPYDYIRDRATELGGDLKEEDFERERRKHQQISRAGAEKKFGGHGFLLDTGELKAANEEELKIVTRLHTATHLLQAALRKVLGENVHQAGSDITAERTRFDFTFDRKLTLEEIRRAEFLINDVIRRDLTMEYREMPFQEAIALGALYSPREKYPDMVKVYSAWNPKTEEVFSRELCGGPHVTHTGKVGGFRIGKQEAVSAGVRRIRGHLV